MIERELWMHAIAYNLVRALLLEASLTHDVPIERLSFKGALDALQAWGDRALRDRRHRGLARRALLARVAADRAPLHPARSEPRARKRLQKDYQLLNRPRRVDPRLVPRVSLGELRVCTCARNGSGDASCSRLAGRGPAGELCRGIPPDKVVLPRAPYRRMFVAKRKLRRSPHAPEKSEKDRK
jgi:hypothetical protein